MQLLLKDWPASWRPFQNQISATCACDFKVHQTDCSIDVCAGDPILVLGTITDNSAFYVLHSTSRQHAWLPARAVHFAAHSQLPTAAEFRLPTVITSPLPIPASNPDAATPLSHHVQLTLAASTGAQLLDEASFEAALFADHPLMSPPFAGSSPETSYGPSPQREVDSMSDGDTAGSLLFWPYHLTGSPTSLPAPSLLLDQKFPPGNDAAVSNTASAIPPSRIITSRVSTHNTESEADSAPTPTNASPGFRVITSPYVTSPGSTYSADSDIDSAATTRNSRSDAPGPDRHQRMRNPEWDEKYEKKRKARVPKLKSSSRPPPCVLNPQTRHGMNLLLFQKDRFPRKSNTGMVTHVGTLDGLLDLLAREHSKFGGNMVFTSAACEAALTRVARSTKEIWRVWLPQEVWIKFRTLKAACAPPETTHPEFAEMLLDLGGLEAGGKWSRVNDHLVQRAHDWISGPSLFPVTSPPSNTQAPPMEQFDAINSYLDSLSLVDPAALIDPTTLDFSSLDSHIQAPDFLDMSTTPVYPEMSLSTSPSNMPLRPPNTSLLHFAPLNLWSLDSYVRTPVLLDMSTIPIQTGVYPEGYPLTSSSDMSRFPTNVASYPSSFVRGMAHVSYNPTTGDRGRSSSAPPLGPSSPANTTQHTHPRVTSTTPNSRLMGLAATQLGKRIGKSSPAPAQHSSDHEAASRRTSPSSTQSNSAKRSGHLSAVQNRPSRGSILAVTSCGPAVATPTGAPPSSDAIKKRTPIVRPGVARRYSLPLSKLNDATSAAIRAATTPYGPEVIASTTAHARHHTFSVSPLLERASGAGKQLPTGIVAPDVVPMPSQMAAETAISADAPAERTEQISPRVVESLDDAVRAWIARFDAQALVRVLIANDTPAITSQVLAGIIAPLSSGTLRTRPGAGPALDAAVVKRTAALLLWLREQEMVREEELAKCFVTTVIGSFTDPELPPLLGAVLAILVRARSISVISVCTAAKVVGDHDDDEPEETESDEEHEVTIDTLSDAVTTVKVYA
ncbi:hypothetical protein BDK51DRAFT_37100 [Blyttiomyces helicus]|uniref:Uncharacterized protein n=1 Tax=Blyttiomyces helicus TaxID=388810 RepID=A0A4P9WIE5_9FUNG|nr:hypothetical protein BDK51DRAFT_37100 [Blyttiomyces helicus]|eukprot:RKO91653.1 hypothetical protein BDK51DRAFT_37100 [Blyttiomyces helicus]